MRFENKTEVTTIIEVIDTEEKYVSLKIVNCLIRAERYNPFGYSYIPK